MYVKDRHLNTPAPHPPSNHPVCTLLNLLIG